MTMPNLKLWDPHPHLNVCYSLINPRDLAGRWIRQKTNERAIKGGKEAGAAKKMAALAVERFEKHLEYASQIIKERFRTRVQPFHYTFSVLHWFYFFAEKYMQKLIANAPDACAVLQQQWEEFLGDFAWLRYYEMPSMFTRMQTYFQGIIVGLEAIGELSEEDRSEINAWEEIFKEPNILEVDLAMLLETHKFVGEPNVKIGVRHLLEAFYLMACRLRKNLPWVLGEIEARIFPHRNDKQHEVFSNAQDVLKEIEKVKKEGPLKLSEIVIDDLKVLVALQPQVMELNHLLNSLTQPQKRGSREIPGVLSDFSSLLEAMIQALPLLEEESEPDTHQFNLDDYFSFPSDVSYHLGLWTLPEARRMQTYLAVHLECHVLWDAYVAAPLLAFLRSFEALRTWYAAKEKLKSPNHITQLLPLLEKGGAASNLPPSRRDVEEKSVEEILAFIGEDKKGEQRQLPKKTKTARARKKAKPIKEAPVVDKQKENQTVTSMGCFTSSEVSLPLIVPEIRPDLLQAFRLLGALQKLCVQQNFGKNLCPKIALRQAIMYLRDFMGDFQSLSEGEMGDSKGYGMTSMVGVTYYYLEQWLRYHIFVQRKDDAATDRADWHNLKRYLCCLSFGEGVDFTLPQSLYLANYWTTSTYDQTSQWWHYSRQTGEPIPPVLVDLHDVAEHFTSEMTEHVVCKLVDDFRAALDFSSKLPLVSVGGHSISGEVPICQPVMFRYKVEISLNALDVIEKECSNILQMRFFSVEHPVRNKLKQALRDLYLLRKIFARLAQDGVSSEEFSKHVRRAVFWQHHFLEGLCRAIYAAQTLRESYEHNISALFQKIRWKNPQGLAQDMQFLEEYFFEGRKVALYPFEYSQPTSHLHRVILKAEILREEPYFGEGFSVSGASKYQTECNFVPVSKEGLNPETLMRDVVYAFEGCCSLVSKRLVPELKHALKI